VNQLISEADMNKPTPTPAAVATGMDVSDKWSAILTVDESGEEAERTRIRTTPEAMREYYGGRSKMYVVIETGPHARWIALLLTELGHDVLVANARRVRAIYENENKADNVDAEMLARLRRTDPKLLYPVETLGRDFEALSIVRARDRLVQARSKLVNCVRGMVKTVGQRMGKCDADRFHHRRDEIPVELRAALTPVMDAIEALNGHISDLDTVAERLCEVRYPVTTRLRQVHGVGPLVALTFVLVIGDPTRFTSSRIGSYLGLRPKRYQSGESDPQRGITKCGDQLLRRYLVGSAYRVMARKPSALRDWGEKLFLRGGKKAKKRAAVAVARKLAVVLHKLWSARDAAGRASSGGLRRG
jgi:transposase